MSRTALTAGSWTLALAAAASLGCAPEPDPDPVGPVVPEDLDYCAIARDWEPEWTSFEDEVLELLNEQRALGATCGPDNELAPAAALRSNPALRCAARVHADDMGAREFFSNLDPDGVDFYQRAELAGYEGTALAQGIGAVHADPALVVQVIMNNSNNCAQVMNPEADEIGIGWTPKYESAYWALTLGAS